MIKSVLRSLVLSLILVLILVITFISVKYDTGDKAHALVVMTILAMILAFGAGLNIGLAEHAGLTELVVAMVAMLSATTSCVITIWHIKNIFGICVFVIVAIACLVYAVRSLLPEILDA
ncbi:MAG: hypothetical protein WCV71_04645 [Patescibacteria group bacterium]